MVSRLHSLSPMHKRLTLVTFDIVALVVAVWLSFSMRLGPEFFPSPAQFGLMALAPITAIPVFIKMGLYRAVIRYLPERAIWTILRAVTLSSLVWLTLLFLAELTRVGELPRSVPIFYWFFGTVFIAGSRFIAKAFLQGAAPRGRRGLRVAIYGAGAAGSQLATALRANGDRLVAAFLDDNESLWGRDVAGIRVYRPADLGSIINELGIGEVIISLPAADATRRREVVAFVSQYPVKIRSLPAIADLASGKYLVSQVQQIDIDELLGRSSVPADPEMLASMVRGRHILVSGAGGSIGSELVRLVAKLGPGKLVLLEANEFALYNIDRQLRGAHEFPVIPLLGSVTDEQLVRRAIATHGVDVVFHAAAHKHVPLVEGNALEGIRNNIVGTHVLTRVAFETGVKNFVLISTDKAVRPTNVMGATKRWAELVVQYYGAEAESRQTGQRFSAVRFGNVLGSNGSVVPLFKEQIDQGGPVTLTDVRMTRYFMSIHEAAELIVQAGALSEGGDIFLLDMGEPVLIRDLAENMIRLAGLTTRSEDNPEGDIEIIEVGKRPGEKLYEELFYDAAGAVRTAQAKIYRLADGDGANTDILHLLEQLEAALADADEAECRRILFDVINQHPEAGHLP